MARTHRKPSHHFEAPSNFFSSTYAASNQQQHQQEVQNEFDQINDLNKPDETAENDNGEHGSSTYDILQNSQAFARITELARKTGAINGHDEFFVDAATGCYLEILNLEEYIL